MNQRHETGPTDHTAAGRAERDERVRRYLDRARHASTEAERRRYENRVIEEHRYVCRSVAAKFAHRGEIDDLEQIAAIGLIKAARRWEPGKCDAFLQYALPTMTGEIRRHLRDNATTIRIPRRMQELRAELRRPENAGAPLSVVVAEVADRTGTPESIVRQASAVSDFSSPLSLNAGTADDLDGPMPLEVGATESGYNAVETWELLEAFLPTLEPMEREALQLRVGPELSQAQIAKRIGVSQMQVCRILARVARKARSFCNPDAAFAA
jgi:RNA polymerase sigma-B factor